ncbi:transcriptional regulator, partial [Bradyrhizobium sp. CCBAU 21359]
ASRIQAVVVAVRLNVL